MGYHLHARGLFALLSLTTGCSAGGGWANFDGGAGGSAGSDYPYADGRDPQSWRSLTDETLFASVSLGGGETLELSRVRVSVRVEGLRARTLVDHIFYNPHDQSLEGTFRYALPPESSVSYYGMFLGNGTAEPEFFGPDDALRSLDAETEVEVTPEQVAASADPAVWGELREGRLVRAARALEVYEDVSRPRPEAIDPALVEEVAPNTFEARVFPIAPHGYNRVLVVYEQTLPRVGDQLEYLFPLPEGAVGSVDFSLVALGDELGAAYTGDVEGVTSRAAAAPAATVFELALAEQSPGGKLAFRFAGGAGNVDALAGTNPVRGEDFFLVRVQPEADDLPAASAGGAAQAVFLVDTSLSEHPDRFAVDRALVAAILEASPAIARFNVITFDVAARWLREQWIPNTAPEREAVLAELDGILLEGATDFDAALRTLAAPPFAPGADLALDLFVLTDGALDWGNLDAEGLVAEHVATSPFAARVFAYRTGLGAENEALFAALTRSGATFNCLTSDSVPACAVAHQQAGLTIDEVTVTGAASGASVADDLLVVGGQASLFAGARLLVTGRLLAAGDAVLAITGEAGGVPTTLTYPVSLVPAGVLAPRAWAEAAVAELLRPRDPALEGLAMALSQHYRVPSRLASYLVLESDAEYDLYELDDERAAFTGQSLAALVEEALASLAVLTSWDRLDRVFCDFADASGLLALDGGEVYGDLVALADGDGLELPSSTLVIAPTRTDEVPAAYAAARTDDPDATAIFRGEAERRRAAGDVGGAVRALSSLVENDPGSAEAARLVAYQLGTWDQAPAATGLLLTVLERRPFEPQSYRDLGNSIWTERPVVSALLFESAIAGDWDARFVGLDTVVREEYALFIRDQQRQAPTAALSGYLGTRRDALGLVLPPSDLRVTMTWNTNYTDIDLWVTNPGGEKCYYADRTTAEGGELLDDITQGFGPERFVQAVATPGTYVVQVHYFGNNGNRLYEETAVNVTVVTHLGEEDEQLSRYSAFLPRSGDLVTVAAIEL